MDHGTTPAADGGARDPVCGMRVDPATAAESFEYKGTTYYFCCDGCLGMFRADPAKYLAKHARSTQSEAAPVSASAKDPVCGMTVDPASAAHFFDHEGTRYYFCCNGCRAKFQADPEKYLAKRAAATHMAAATMTDPVCGMKVEPSSAAGTHEYKGINYFFCSKHCLAQFKADPDEVPHEDGPDPGRAKGCPVHLPDAPGRSCKTGPGSCPKCGMALVPMVPAAAAAEYTCPMHPEVRSPTPGNCPKCGMALVPVAGAQEDDSELRDMTRRFWVSLALSVPIVVLAMGCLSSAAMSTRLQCSAGARWRRARARHSGRALGRLAVLPQVLAFARRTAARTCTR